MSKDAQWIVIALLIAGTAFLAGWKLAPAHKVQTKEVVKTRTVYKEMPRSRTDESTEACKAKGGVPTYSAWNGELNGCLGI